MSRFNFSTIPGLQSGGFAQTAGLQSQNLQSTLDRDLAAQQQLQQLVQQRIANKQTANSQLMQLQEMRQQGSAALADITAKFASIKQAKEQGLLENQNRQADRQLSAQQFNADQTRRANEFNTGLQADQDARLFETFYNNQARQEDAALRERLAGQELTSRENIAEQELTSRERLANQELLSNERLTERQVSSRETLTREEIANSMALSEADRAFKGDQAALDRVQQFRLLDQNTAKELELLLAEQKYRSVENKRDRWLQLRLAQIEMSGKTSLPSETALTGAGEIIANPDVSAQDIQDTYSAQITTADKQEIERAALIRFKSNLAKIGVKSGRVLEGEKAKDSNLNISGENLNYIKEEDIRKAFAESGLLNLPAESSSILNDQLLKLEPEFAAYDDTLINKFLTGSYTVTRGLNKKKNLHKSKVLTPILQVIDQRIEAIESGRSQSSIMDLLKEDPEVFETSYN